jgi:hypothetical protein
MVLDGPVDSPCFKAYVNQFLVPTLKPGDMVVMDNLSAHKSEDSRRHRRRPAWPLEEKACIMEEVLARQSLLQAYASPSSPSSRRPPARAVAYPRPCRPLSVNAPSYGEAARCGLYSQKRDVNKAIKTPMKHPATAEPVIGHMKEHHRMGRNFLAHGASDAINTVLAAAGYNVQRLLAWFTLLLGPYSR